MRKKQRSRSKSSTWRPERLQIWRTCAMCDACRLWRIVTYNYNPHLDLNLGVGGGWCLAGFAHDLCGIVTRAWPAPCTFVAAYQLVSQHLLLFKMFPPLPCTAHLSTALPLLLFGRQKRILRKCTWRRKTPN